MLTDRNVAIFKEVLRLDPYAKIGKKYAIAASTVADIFVRLAVQIQTPELPYTDRVCAIAEAPRWRARIDEVYREQKKKDQEIPVVEPVWLHGLMSINWDDCP